jgi:hypothetical protein
MRHRPDRYVLRQIENEVPAGAALAAVIRRTNPEVIKVTPTQMQFLKKLDLIDYHGQELKTLSLSSIRVELMP